MNSIEQFSKKGTFTMTHLFRPAIGLMVCSAFVWALGAPTNADAGLFGWFGHGSHGGSWGSHGSSGGWYGGSHGGSGGWYGGSHGSSGGWYGSHGSSGGSSGGYHHNGIKSNGNGDGNGGGNESARRDNRVARVVVKVPENAKVYLQDQPMSLTGKVRKFVSPRLDPQREYEYTVRVELEQDGQTLTETAKTRVKAGQRVEVSVDFAEDNPNQLVASIERR